MEFIPGKLYQSHDKIWNGKSWLPYDSLFIFMSKERSNKTWQIYKFIYKQKIVEFDFHDSSMATMDNVFSLIK